MVNGNRLRNRSRQRIKKLDDPQRALLSIILMNKGQIKGSRLKRIYLEKYSLWELQSTQEKLGKWGYLVKLSKESGAESSVYTVPERFQSALLPYLATTSGYPDEVGENHFRLDSPCQEFSILWYLMEIDSLMGADLIGSKTKKPTRMAFKRVEEVLKITEGESEFFMYLVEDLSKGDFFKKNRIKKWVQVLNSSIPIVGKIYKVIYYELGDNTHLGRGDVGKDNVDFLLDELAALRAGIWYPLEVFVENAKTTLFLANQPDRWIHFNEENIWKILNNELKLFWVVNTIEDINGKRYFSKTILGDYCLEEISKDEFESSLAMRTGRLMVHPNFEVTLVSREVNPMVILELSMFSENIITDTVSVFRISRESVRKGIIRGLSPDMMTEFLKENCKGEVPQNVAYSISDWGD